MKIQAGLDCVETEMTREEAVRLRCALFAGYGDTWLAENYDQTGVALSAVQDVVAVLEVVRDGDVVIRLDWTRPAGSGARDGDGVPLGDPCSQQPVMRIEASGDRVILRMTRPEAGVLAAALRAGTERISRAEYWMRTDLSRPAVADIADALEASERGGERTMTLALEPGIPEEEFPRYPRDRP